MSVIQLLHGTDHIIEVPDHYDGRVLQSRRG